MYPGVLADGQTSRRPAAKAGGQEKGETPGKASADHATGLAGPDDPVGRRKPMARLECHSTIDLWESGIADMLIIRREPGGGLIFDHFAVDVWCLGVKQAHWGPCTADDIEEIVETMEQAAETRPIAPEKFVKLIQGAVDFAVSWGFAPCSDYQHVSKLLEGIDPTLCTEEFWFGKHGKPFYVRGPQESIQEAEVISQKVQEQGGEAIIPINSKASIVYEPGDDLDEDLDYGLEGDIEEFEEADRESGSKWRFEGDSLPSVARPK